MARSLLNFPVATAPTSILGQAFWDGGRYTHLANTTNWTSIGGISSNTTGSSGLLEYTVAKNNPKLDLEFNVGCDHRQDWSSLLIRMMYKLNQGSSWSSNWSSLGMYQQLSAFNDSRHSCGNAAGAFMLWEPSLNAGSKVAFRLEVAIDSSSASTQINQSTENQNGEVWHNATDNHGGGLSIRLREWDSSVYSVRGDRNQSS